MSTFRNRLTRRQAARLLDYPESNSGSRSGDLGALLSAAQPQAEGAVPGEDLAAARFAAATTLAPTQGRSLVRSVRKLVAAPAAALTAAGLVLAGGGLAFAASQGSVHVPFTGHDHRSSHAPAAPSSTNPGLNHTTGPVDASDEPSDGPTGEPSASPSPSLDGLCRAFRAGATHGTTQDNPAFSALYAAAGGTDKVEAFCTKLIGPAPTHPAKPTHPARPTQAPTSHPTHPALPTQAPTSHPAKPSGSATPNPHKPSRAP